MLAGQDPLLGRRIEVPGTAERERGGAGRVDGKGAAMGPHLARTGCQQPLSALFVRFPALQVLWRVLDDETQQQVTKVCAGPAPCGDNSSSTSSTNSGRRGRPGERRRSLNSPPGHDRLPSPLLPLQWWGALIINRNFQQTDNMGRPVYILRLAVAACPMPLAPPPAPSPAPPSPAHFKLRSSAPPPCAAGTTPGPRWTLPRTSGRCPL